MPLVLLYQIIASETINKHKKHTNDIHGNSTNRNSNYSSPTIGLSKLLNMNQMKCIHLPFFKEKLGELQKYSLLQPEMRYIKKPWINVRYIPTLEQFIADDVIGFSNTDYLEEKIQIVHRWRTYFNKKRVIFLTKTLKIFKKFIKNHQLFRKMNCKINFIFSLMPEDFLTRWLYGKMLIDFLDQFEHLQFRIKRKSTNPEWNIDRKFIQSKHMKALLLYFIETEMLNLIHPSKKPNYQLSEHSETSSDNTNSRQTGLTCSYTKSIFTRMSPQDVQNLPIHFIKIMYDFIGYENIFPIHTNTELLLIKKIKTLCPDIQRLIIRMIPRKTTLNYKLQTIPHTIAKEMTIGYHVDDTSKDRLLRYFEWSLKNSRHLSTIDLYNVTRIIFSIRHTDYQKISLNPLTQEQLYYMTFFQNNISNRTAMYLIDDHSNFPLEDIVNNALFCIKTHMDGTHIMIHNDTIHPKYNEQIYEQTEHRVNIYNYMYRKLQKHNCTVRKYISDTYMKYFELDCFNSLYGETQIMIQNPHNINSWILGAILLRWLSVACTIMLSGCSNITEKLVLLNETDLEKSYSSIIVLQKFIFQYKNNFSFPHKWKLFPVFPTTYMEFLQIDYSEFRSIAPTFIVGNWREIDNKLL